jgi:hypothetical protein
MTTFDHWVRYHYDFAECRSEVEATLWARDWSHICTVFAAVAACRQAHEDGAATIPWDRWGAR